MRAEIVVPRCTWNIVTLAACAAFSYAEYQSNNHMATGFSVANQGQYLLLIVAAGAIFVKREGQVPALFGYKGGGR